MSTTAYALLNSPKQTDGITPPGSQKVSWDQDSNDNLMIPNGWRAIWNNTGDYTIDKAGHAYYYNKDENDFIRLIKVYRKGYVCSLDGTTDGRIEVYFNYDRISKEKEFCSEFDVFDFEAFSDSILQYGCFLGGNAEYNSTLQGNLIFTISFYNHTQAVNDSLLKELKKYGYPFARLGDFSGEDHPSLSTGKKITKEEAAFYTQLESASLSDTTEIQTLIEQAKKLNSDRFSDALFLLARKLQENNQLSEACQALAHILPNQAYYRVARNLMAKLKTLQLSMQIETLKKQLSSQANLPDKKEGGDRGILTAYKQASGSVAPVSISTPIAPTTANAAWMSGTTSSSTPMGAMTSSSLFKPTLTPGGQKG